MPKIPEDLWLMGPLKPMRFEAVVEDCIVSSGEVPADLHGGFYRCGPAWKRPTKQGVNGFFTMDGMVQALILRAGRVDFRNRWVRSPKYLLEERHGQGMFEWEDGKFTDWRHYGLSDVVRDEFNRGVPQGTYWINAFPCAGEILVSGEQGGPPIALDPLTLETRGMVPWSLALARGMVEPACFGDGAFTAHPKWDSATGELFGWSYRDEAPYVTVYRIGIDGAVRSLVLEDAPYPTNAHDGWLTEHYLILPFQGFLNDRRRIARDLPVFGWDPTLPVRLALVPRTLEGDVVWIDADIDPQYVMHTIGGNEAGTTITLDAPIYNRPPFAFEDRVPFGTAYLPTECAQLGRWTIDLARQRATSERLDNRAVEFPKIDERFYGRDYKTAFLTSGDSLWTFDTVIRRDVHSGAETSYTVKREGLVTLIEPTFIPRTPDAPEADGYLVLPISKWQENTSEFLIFDTQDVAAGPITQIDLPFQIGWTAHGHWMDLSQSEQR